MDFTCLHHKSERAQVVSILFVIKDPHQVLLILQFFRVGPLILSFWVVEKKSSRLWSLVKNLCHKAGYAFIGHCLEVSYCGHVWLHFCRQVPVHSPDIAVKSLRREFIFYYGQTQRLVQDLGSTAAHHLANDDLIKRN